MTCSRPCPPRTGGRGGWRAASLWRRGRGRGRWCGGRGCGWRRGRTVSLCSLSGPPGQIGVEKIYLFWVEDEYNLINEQVSSYTCIFCSPPAYGPVTEIYVTLLFPLTSFLCNQQIDVPLNFLYSFPEGIENMRLGAKIFIKWNVCTVMQNVLPLRWKPWKLYLLILYYFFCYFLLFFLLSFVIYKNETCLFS